MRLSLTVLCLSTFCACQSSSTGSDEACDSGQCTGGGASSGSGANDSGANDSGANDSGANDSGGDDNGADDSGADDSGADGEACSVCDVSLPVEEGSVSEYFGRFQMPVEREGCTTLHRPHSARRWNIFYTGRCSGCRVPNRISSAAFGDTFFVSWVGSAAYADSDDANARRFGHLSTFNFTEDDGFTKTNDFVFEECNYDMGSVTVSPDGSVIGALCISDRPDHDHQNNVILYEWTGGQITQIPDVREVVNTAAGGWNYGHWDLSLNNDLTHYYVTAKTVTNDGAHEGMTRFAWNRETREIEPNAGNCAGGHPTSNRITHNKHDDSWSVLCRMDQKSINWVQASGPDFGGSLETLGEWVVTDIANTPGGLHNAISLGEDGWLVAATGPFDIWEGLSDGDERSEKLQEQQIGLRRLPLEITEFVENQDAYPWTWIDQDRVCAPTKGGEPLAGMVQLHNWGAGGEDSGRILMGYSPTRSHTSAEEFHAVEVDTEGNFLHAPVLLQRGGWGIDTLGTYMPGSGCVVFPLTWNPDEPEEGIGNSYPTHEEPITDRSEYLKFTALCPVDDVPQGNGPLCGVQASRFSEAAPQDPQTHQMECPSF